MRRFRTVIDTHEFVEQLAEIEADVKRADEFVDAVKTALAIDPYCGTHLTGSLWMIPINQEVPTPLTVYYTFDTSNVYLLWIQIDTPFD